MWFFLVNKQMHDYSLKEKENKGFNVWNDQKGADRALYWICVEMLSSKQPCLFSDICTNLVT